MLRARDHDRGDALGLYVCAAWVFEFPTAPSHITANRAASNAEICSLTVSEPERVKPGVGALLSLGVLGQDSSLPLSAPAGPRRPLASLVPAACLHSPPLSSRGSVSVCPLLLLQGCQSLDLRTSSGLDHVCKKPPLPNQTRGTSS